MLCLCMQQSSMSAAAAHPDPEASNTAAAAAVGQSRPPLVASSRVTSDSSFLPHSQAFVKPSALAVCWAAIVLKMIEDLAQFRAEMSKARKDVYKQPITSICETEIAFEIAFESAAGRVYNEQKLFS